MSTAQRNAGLRISLIGTLALSLILFAISFVYLIPGIHQPVNIYDEGIVVYSAVRVMDGHVPYRDFWSIYSPAQFYALAALFKLFGTTILVERLWDTALRALVAVCAYLLAARLTNQRVALLAWLAVTVWVGYYSYSYVVQWVFYGYPAFPAIAFCFASILALMRYFERLHLRLLLVSGVLLGVAALFRHDFAIYNFVGQGLALVLFNLLRAVNYPASLAQRVGRVIKDMLIFGLGAAVLVLPVAFYFIVQVPLHELIYDLFTFPASVFPRFRDLPYPPFKLFDTLAFYLPFPVFALAGVVAVLMLRQRTYSPDTSRHVANALGILMLIVFGLLAFNQARVRSDLIHTPAFFLPAVILIVTLLRGLAQPRSGNTNSGAVVWAIFVTIMLVAVLIQPVGDRVQLLTDPERLSPPITHDLERAQVALVGPEMVQVVRYIQAQTDPQARIFVGNSFHDRILANEPMFYFLAARHSATRYHELHPGVATTEPVQREIIADLEQAQAPYVVLSRLFEGALEPNESAVSSGVKQLDEYIAEHYRLVQQFGPYLVLRRQ